MSSLIHGETVILETKEETGKDGLNNPVWTTSEAVVPNVLVVPGPRADLIESNRPDGKIVKYTLHFPKTFTGDLKGCRVKVRGKWCLVVGAPDRYTPENTPGEWNMPAEVEATDG
jgi:hypothetical protein